MSEGEGQDKSDAYLQGRDPVTRETVVNGGLRLGSGLPAAGSLMAHINQDLEDLHAGDGYRVEVSVLTWQNYLVAEFLAMQADVWKPVLVVQ